MSPDRLNQPPPNSGTANLGLLTPHQTRITDSWGGISSPDRACQSTAARPSALSHGTAERLSGSDYQRLAKSIREIVNSTVPLGSIIAVISKGDSQLVDFKKRAGWHFPQESDGRYSGYYPSDSSAAIQELEKIHNKGADFLLIPSTAFWWLSYYEEFGRRLELKERTIWSDRSCRIYKLAGRRVNHTPAANRPRTGRSAHEHRSGDNLSLRLAIDSRIPGQLVVGEGNAFYIAGWCYHPASKLACLEIVCNGSATPIRSWKIPRPDVQAAHYPQRDCAGESLRSGFWGLVRVERVQIRTEARVLVRAKLHNGMICEQMVGHIVLEPGTVSGTRAEAVKTEPAVAICMATYNPPLELFRRQVESIRNQTFRNWICLISDDGSRPDLFEKASGIIGTDRRFRIFRTQTGQGFYGNFEKCLSQAPEGADFIALSDQDDHWHPDKLETLLNCFDAETTLAYSDMRIVDEAGREISPTYWTTRPNNFTRFSSLLMANTITGGACMFRRSLLPLILPFPQKIGEAYHDHWIGVVALAVGKLGYVKRALYDYVQHGANVIGHFAPQKPMTLFPANLDWRRPAEMLRQTLRSWESIYFADLLRLHQMIELLQLRCRERISTEKRAEMRRVQGIGLNWRNSLWLARRALATRGKITETVNAERYLLGAAVWRHSARSSLRTRLLTLGAAASAVQSPAPVAPRLQSVDMARDKITPLLLEVEPHLPRRLNLLVPTIDLNYFFGGYITKFNLAKQLARDGLRVRMVIVDHCDWQPDRWRKQLKKFNGLEDFFDHVEVEYAYDRRAGLKVSPSDTFMATTWWTAHIAREAVRVLGGHQFVYLIQEYEPFTFAMGSLSALANQSYEFPHFAVFSTEMLREYFRENAIGVFAEGTAHGENSSISFQNAITEVGQIARHDLAARSAKRLLYYARPEAHAARNMFELGILALTEAVDAGYFDEGWEFYGIGSIGSMQKIPLARGRCLTMLPRENQEAYGDILRAHDVGLALMYTPHPSLVPIEMASAGMVVVTTAFANKTQEVLGQVSSNLIAVHPSIAQIKQGLKHATERVFDYDGRVKGARVNWATNWERAFNPMVKAKIREFVQASADSTTSTGVFPSIMC